MPSAPSLSAFLSDSSGAASVAVAKSKAYAHVYEGSFTMQAWFRADAALTETSHQVFGNYFRDTSGSSVFWVEGSSTSRRSRGAPAFTG